MSTFPTTERPVICLMLAGWLGCHAATAGAEAEGEDLKNWFGDPFFQVSGGQGGCPLPRGPFMTEKEKIDDSHSRAERGTTCWLAGECERPNSYLYDAGIAETVRKRMADDPPIADDSLWVTVTRRFVFVEGCVADRKREGEIEALVREVPHVDRVFVNVMQGTSGRPPYRLREHGAR